MSEIDRTCEVAVFVDVDGVLNAVNPKTPRGWAWPDERTEAVNGFRIRWSPTLVGRVNGLAAMPHVRPHWLTTWEDDARTHLSPAIGVHGEEWPVVGTEDHYSKELQGGWWKLKALRDLLGETPYERLVWIDDDITFNRDARLWLAENPWICWVSPSTEQGITPEQMDRIEAYVAGDA